MANHNSHPPTSYQPLKLLFQIGYAVTVAARLPIWAITALLPPLRQHPSWTAKQSFLAHLAYMVLDTPSRIGITETLSLESRKEGDQFQVINPADSRFYEGPLVSDIKPAAVGGTWYPHRPRVGADWASSLVVLHLHGGAFVTGNGRIHHGGFVGKNWVEECGAAAVFVPQYRLSGYAGLNPFPAALQDSLTAYAFLLYELGVPAHQIVLAGNSSGGNLAVALLRYIKEFGHNLGLPTPRCAVLLSPWVSPFDYDLAENPNRVSDYVPKSFLRWGAETYAGHLPDARANPYITPSAAPFAVSVPMLVSVGTAELFHGAVTNWVGKMNELSENSVELYHENGASHDTFFSGNLTGFDESTRVVAAKIREFL
ncbi:alpha/beta hydrolase fold-3 domain-containing protein [Hypoxylon rubiginosum]|uniref:Alpha/beta hydrolase fold-3 domain-containing protein n=1 Tax=Hypoxylon rubiginosum TaxID=110542 RepID=A0ACB9Z012_9PEZI|nr:alpha/beta hydrolase fold-3 domain-containing protein [Hypoxylon rubiginosum]